MKDIIIIGAGGFGREILWLIEDINASSNCNEKWNVLGFVDDNLNGPVIGKYNVIGNINYLLNKSIAVFIAVADSKIKEAIYKRLIKTNLVFPNLVHPSVIRSRYTKLGIGNVICAMTVVSTDVVVHNFVSINYGSTIGHDVIAENFVTILPGCRVSGNVRLKKKSMIGTGTQIIQGLTIGKDSIIGAGSVVISNIGSNIVAAGIPCKEIKKKV